MIYKPHYLNVDRRYIKAMGSNAAYFNRTVDIPLGWRKKPPREIPRKSGRHFPRKVRWSDISRRLG